MKVFFSRILKKRQAEKLHSTFDTPETSTLLPLLKEGKPSPLQNDTTSNIW